jgi:lipoprotein NlpI
LAISPEHKDVYSNLGQAYKDWGKYNEAMEAFQKVIFHV